MTSQKGFCFWEFKGIVLQVFLFFFLHGFKLVDPLLCVTLSDLPQGLVFVPAGLHVLAVKEVVLGGLGLVACLGQLLSQGLRADGDEVSRAERIHFIFFSKRTDKGSVLQSGWRVHLNCVCVCM